MTAPEYWDEFLENIATRLKINGQPKNIFVTRFAWKNCNISNEKFLERLESNEIKVLHPDIYRLTLVNYNKCIGQAYYIFENDKENGCLELVNQGNRKRDFLLEWLKEQYGQWVEEQKSKFADSSRHQQTNHNWHEVCCNKLNHWKKRNVDLVIRDNRLDFDNIDRTFVPLDFLEKVKKESSQSKNADQLGKQPTEEYKSTQRYERQQDFLDVIIRGELSEGMSKKQAQRLAIIGEAGSGKTTLLLQIGYELLKQPNNLVIWISLKEVRNKQKSIWDIRDYILEEWLKGSDTTKNEWEQEFDNKLKDGYVWLLLDGLEDISDRAYSVIGQFDDWLSKPKIALTCRKNRWDSDKADFASFDYGIYECVGYNFDQPSNFIDAWFGDDSESANLLKSELQQVTRHRINDLIKYPLHLSLLCSIYEKSELSFAFASTKAELFDQFIKRQYKRKVTIDRFDTDLVKSLGELAIKSIDTQSQLTDAEVKEKLGNRLDKALELGWLKPIDEYEKVYDFLHDSFKEYFSALAIADWDFFVPIEHFNNSTPVKGKDYRIFSSHWKQVILFWISRSNVEFKIKEEFIYRLMYFLDDCGSFYKFRALCLATECLSEFKQVELKQIEHLNLLLNLITSYAFILGSDDFYNLYNSNFAEASRLTLKNLKINELSETLENRISKINVLKSQFPSDKSIADFDELEIAKILISISPSNQTAFNILIKLIENNRHNYTFTTCDAIRTISKSTYEFSIYPDKVVLFLVELLNDDKYSYALKDIFESLGDACKYENFNSVKNSIIDFLNKKEELDNLEIIQSLKILIVVKEHFQIIDIEDILLGYLKKLLKTHDKNEKILSELILIIEKLNNISLLVSNLEELMSNSSDDLSLKISECLIDFDCKNEKAIEYFRNHFSLPRNTKSLVKVANDNKDIQKHLIECLLQSSDLGCKFDILNVLIKTDCSKGIISNILVDTIKKANLSENQWVILETTEIITELNLSIPEDIVKILRKLADNSQDNRIVYGAIRCLLYSHNDNIVEINKLLMNFENYKSKLYLDILMNDLTHINLGKHKDKVVKSIENIINLCSEIYLRNKLYRRSINDLEELNIEEYIWDLPFVVDGLFEIDGKNLTALAFLLNLLKDICVDIINSADNLKRLEYNFSKNIESVIKYSDKSRLVLIVEVCGGILNLRLKEKSHFLYNQFHKLIWHCAQNMSYPDFYEAWHSQPTSTHPEVRDTIPSNNTNKIQTLESQLIDCEAIQKELDRTTDHPKIRCLVVDISHLENFTDQNLLSKRIWNGLQKQFPDCEFPKVNDIGDLEYELNKLQRNLGKKLAIALYGKSANEAINQLCQSLEPIQIRPFTGGQATQELITKINAWLSEM